MSIEDVEMRENASFEGPDDVESSVGLCAKDTYQETLDKRKSAQDMIAAATAVYMAAMMGIVAILTQKERGMYEDIPVLVIGVVVSVLYVIMFVWRYAKVIRTSYLIRRMRPFVRRGALMTGDVENIKKDKVKWTRKERVVMICFVVGSVLVSITCLEIPLLRI